MNFKKIISSTAIGVGMLSLMVPSAFACYWPNDNSTENKMTIKSVADVDTDIVTIANTGGNELEISGNSQRYHWGGRHNNNTVNNSISSGDATAVADVYADVNPVQAEMGCECMSNTTTGCGRHSRNNSNGAENSLYIKSYADVDTDVFTKANSGWNEITGNSKSGGSIMTGDAGAQSTVMSVVNSSVVSFGM